MLPLRLVIDTNVIVSAALKPDGLQRTLLTIALTKPARLYVSHAVLAEYATAIARKRFRIRKGSQMRLMQQIMNRAHMVKPSHRIEAALDPDDNIFLECADAARADYLITGNQKHFPTFWKATKIISGREFIAIVAPHLSPKN
jgi:putative PIN family toxin of toxin-antitoxin system